MTALIAYVFGALDRWVTSVSKLMCGARRRTQTKGDDLRAEARLLVSAHNGGHKSAMKAAGVIQGFIITEFHSGVDR